MLKSEPYDFFKYIILLRALIVESLFFRKA